VAVGERIAFGQALDDHLRAIRERDLDAFAATLSSSGDLRLVGCDGTMVEGREAAIEAHRGWFASADWQFSAQTLWQYERGDTAAALVDVRYEERGKNAGFLLFLLFAGDGDGWKLVYDQGTRP
jgi:ketosteroid isomerase-like protein